MIELIAFVLFLIVFFILIIQNIKLKLKLSTTASKLLQVSIEKTVISEKLLDLSAKSLMQSDNTSDAFLKFVSDSRDWAYQYIDDVQSSLNKFITDVEPEVSYFDRYGDLMAAEPNYNSMKKISGAYKELKKLLPEDYDTIR
jgi:hypothetical protein